MRTYIPSPVVKADDEGTFPFVRVTVATNVCSDEAYTIAFLNENRYTASLTLYLSDEECDFLVEQLAAARAERLAEQEKAYEALHAKFGGTWNNSPAHTEPACGVDGCAVCEQIAVTGDVDE